MAFGISVINDNGSSLIDSAYKNLALVAKGTTMTYQSSAGNPNNPPLTFQMSSWGRVEINGNNPVIALSCATRHVHVAASTRSGTLWTFYFVVDNVHPGQDIVEFFIFDSLPSLTNSQMGLLVKDNTGKVLYQDNDNHMRVVDFFQQPYQTGVVRNYPTGRKYAVVTCISSTYRMLKGYDFNNNHFCWVFSLGWQINQNTMNSGADFFVGPAITGTFQWPGGPPPAYLTDGYFMVLDVTGF